MPECSTMMTEVWLLWLRHFVGRAMATLLGFFLNSLGGEGRGVWCSENRFSLIIFRFIILRVIIISRRDKNDFIMSTSRSIMRRDRMIRPQTDFVRSYFLEVKHFILLGT